MNRISVHFPTTRQCRDILNLSGSLELSDNTTFIYKCRVVGKFVGKNRGSKLSDGGVQC